jgi:hypothetical protein
MKIFLLILMFGTCSLLHSQELNERSFNFWAGTWEAVWIDANGAEVRGTNEIKFIANDKVLQENFYDPSTNFKGTSISVFNPNTKTWHQAWADSNGVYYNFIGGLDDGVLCFKTPILERNGEKIIQRMVFKEIEEKSFTWIWEGSKNGGNSWNELWKINYTRI